MDISGNKKRPNNPATIQSDAAGSPEKPIYQREEDVHHFVPADEDRDTLPYSQNNDAGQDEGGADRQNNGNGGEPRENEEPRENRESGGNQEEQEEEKPKDDVHSAPESGDKLP